MSRSVALDEIDGDDGGDAIDVPGDTRGLDAAGAPPPPDGDRWTAWLCRTALPEERPARMAPQRFEYVSLGLSARLRAAGTSDEAAESVVEGALGHA
ncbi:MAG: hypothetical protein ACK4QW_09125 [Alphaproteobacteria bacterium]